MPATARAILVLLALALAACAQDPASDVLPGESSATGTVRSVVNGIGTPIHAVGKAITCVAGTIVSIPVAALGSISGLPQHEAIGDQMIDGTGRVCGGSYVLGER